MQRGTLYGYIYDEPQPRVFRDVVVRSNFGKDFNRLKIDITANPEKRSNDSYRWTMKSDTVPRQIRDCIGSDHYAAMGSPDATDDDPSGGKLDVHIEADNVVRNDMATFGPVFPNMKIVVGGHNLHALPVVRPCEHVVAVVNRGDRSAVSIKFIEPDPVAADRAPDAPAVEHLDLAAIIQPGQPPVAMRHQHAPFKGRRFRRGGHQAAFDPVFMRENIPQQAVSALRAWYSAADW